MTEAVKPIEQRRLELIRKQAAARKAAAQNGSDGQAPTYETLMAKARELAASGDTANAKRVAEIALKSRRNALIRIQAEARKRQAGQLPEPVDSSPSAFIRQAAALNANQRPLGQVLKENLLGDDDPTTQNTGEKIGSFLNKAGESLTFGLVGDEASAAVESLAPGVNYEDRRDHYRKQEDQFAQDHPVAALGAELAPLAIPGVGTMATAAKGTGLGMRMLQGGAVAGGQGATYGFMEGEGGLGERLQSGATTGALSAGIGGLAPVVGRGAEKYADGRATRKAIQEMVDGAPSPQALKDRAGGFYDAGRARGTIASANEAQTLARDVADTLKREGVMRADGSLITRDPDAKRILDELQDLAQFGLEGNQVKPVRELFSGATRDTNPARARIGKILLDKFDDFVGQRAPEYRQGDELYRRAKKTEAVDQMIDIADTSDTANALRREFQKADRSQIKGKLGGMTDDEVTSMQRVARGSRVENTARNIGRSSPSSLGSAFFTGGLPFTTGAIAGSPGLGAAIGGTALAAGMVGRGLSNRAQRKHAEIAKALMATGGVMPKATGNEALKRKIMEMLLAASPRAGTALGVD